MRRIDHELAAGDREAGRIALEDHREVVGHEALVAEAHPALGAVQREVPGAAAEVGIDEVGDPVESGLAAAFSQRQVELEAEGRAAADAQADKVGAGGVADRALAQEAQQLGARACALDREFERRHAEMRDGRQRTRRRQPQHLPVLGAHLHAVADEIGAHVADARGRPARVVVEIDIAEVGPGLEAPLRLPERPVVEVAVHDGRARIHAAAEQAAVQPLAGRDLHDVDRPEDLGRRDLSRSDRHRGVEMRLAARGIERQRDARPGAEARAGEIEPAGLDAPALRRAHRAERGLRQARLDRRAEHMGKVELQRLVRIERPDRGRFIGQQRARQRTEARRLARRLQRQAGDARAQRPRAAGFARRRHPLERAARGGLVQGCAHARREEIAERERRRPAPEVDARGAKRVRARRRRARGDQRQLGGLAARAALGEVQAPALVAAPPAQRKRGTVEAGARFDQVAGGEFDRLDPAQRQRVRREFDLERRRPAVHVDPGAQVDAARHRRDPGQRPVREPLRRRQPLPGRVAAAQRGALEFAGEAQRHAAAARPGQSADAARTALAGVAQVEALEREAPSAGFVAQGHARLAQVETAEVEQRVGARHRAGRAGARAAQARDLQSAIAAQDQVEVQPEQAELAERHPRFQRGVEIDRELGAVDAEGLAAAAGPLDLHVAQLEHRADHGPVAGERADRDRPAHARREEVLDLVRMGHHPRQGQAGAADHQRHADDDHGDGALGEQADAAPAALAGREWNVGHGTGGDDALTAGPRRTAPVNTALRPGSGWSCPRRPRVRRPRPTPRP